MIDFIKDKIFAKKQQYEQEKYEKKYDILYKRHKGEKALFIVMFIIFVLFAISFIFPFLWVIMNALKTKDDFASNFMSLPKTWEWGNFINAWNYKDAATKGFTVFQMLGMSVLIAGVGTIVTVFTSSAAAYVVAKYEFPGRKLIFSVVVFSLIVPIVGSLPSQIQLMDALHLSNTVIGCIFLYSGGFGMNFLLLYSFFKNLSWTYVEAARIDGASDFKIFFRIIIPMAKGPVIAIAVIQLIGLWNDYLTPSIYLPDKPTIAVGLKLLQTTMVQQGNYTLLFATIIIALIPIVVLFCCFSKTIMENTSVGGLKG